MTRINVHARPAPLNVLPFLLLTLILAHVSVQQLPHVHQVKHLILLRVHAAAVLRVLLHLLLTLQIVVVSVLVQIHAQLANITIYKLVHA